MFARTRTGHLTLRQLEVFEAVARHGSVSRAAEALHLTQPAVSIQMKSLAEAIGQPLIEPLRRGIRLTPAGHELFEFCRDVAADWSRFQSRLDENSALRRGVLRVSVVTTAKYFLPQALGRFVSQYPGIEVHMEVENRDGVLARLRDRLDDLYVMSAPPEGWAIEAHRFLDNPLVVIAPRPWNAPSRRRLTLPALARERFLVREAGSATRMAFDEFVLREKVSLPHRMTVGSNEAIKHAVAGGLGLALISRHTLSPADLEDVKIVPVAGFPLERAWHVVHWRDQHLSAPAEKFRGYLLGMAADARTKRGGRSRPPKAKRPLAG